MVDVNKIQSEQADANELLGDLGLVGDVLKPHELVKFGRAFERNFLHHGLFREFNDIMIRHRPEFLLGAMVAKKQMDAEIDGEQPAPGKIAGPIPIRASFFGIGDDWEDIHGIYSAAQNTWTTGAVQDWIHSGTTLLAGTDGNAIRILDKAVHILVGIADLHVSPKLESAKFTIDGKEKPAHIMNRLRIGGSEQVLRVREFDSAIILKKNSTLKAELFISEAFGALSAFQESFPSLLGVSFVREDVMRIQDPANIVGTVTEVVTTT